MLGGKTLTRGPVIYNGGGGARLGALGHLSSERRGRERDPYAKAEPTADQLEAAGKVVPIAVVLVRDFKAHAARLHTEVHRGDRVD